MFQFRISHLFAAATLLAAGLGYLQCLNTAYETYGAVEACGWTMLTGSVLLIAFGLLLIRRARVGAFIVIICVSAYAIASQYVNAKKLQLLRKEAEQIVEFVEASKQEFGGYPRDLNDYQFRSPGLSNCIWYRRQLDGSCEVWFNPTGETGYGHCFSSRYGYYFEDD